MAEPRLVVERKSVNIGQRVGVSDSVIKPSQKAIVQFNTQNSLINNRMANEARDSIANKLSTTSANDGGNYPKCSSTSGTPCIDTGGYEDKRAYSGSGMAGWKEAGLSGNTNNQISIGGGVTADVFLFGVGASGEIALRNHGSSACLDLTGCGQLGMGLHAGAGFIANLGAENIQPSRTSATVGSFGNFFSVGGSVNAANDNISAGKGVFGIGAGVSGGLQACGSVSVICFLADPSN